MLQRGYTPEYRVNAVELAKEIGTSEAASELKILADTPYTWVSRAQNGNLPQINAGGKPKTQITLKERNKELYKSQLNTSNRNQIKL